MRNANADTSYIMPYDCNPSNLEDTAITVDYLRKAIEKISSEQILLIVDNTSEYDIFNPETSAVFTSISNNKTTIMIASENSQRGGIYKRNGATLFTSYIIEGLKGIADEISGNSDGFVTISELANYAKSEVGKYTDARGKKQTPFCNVADLSLLMPLISVK